MNCYHIGRIVCANRVSLGSHDQTASRFHENRLGPEVNGSILKDQPAVVVDVDKTVVVDVLAFSPSHAVRLVIHLEWFSVAPRRQVNHITGTE